MYELTEGKLIITTEVGQHQIWAAQFINTLPKTISFFRRTWNNGVWPCMHIGQIHRASRQKVINVAGDGSFRMVQ